MIGVDFGVNVTNGRLQIRYKSAIKNAECFYKRAARPFERVEKVDTLQVEISLRELSLENKGFRSRGAHRASPL